MGSETEVHLHTLTSFGSVGSSDTPKTLNGLFTSPEFSPKLLTTSPLLSLNYSPNGLFKSLEVGSFLSFLDDLIAGFSPSPTPKTLFLECTESSTPSSKTSSTLLLTQYLKEASGGSLD